MTMGTRKGPLLAKRREVTKMEKPDDVAAMPRREAAGWGARRTRRGRCWRFRALAGDPPGA